ncbi:DegT/DnrJ/EryC1/StrS family aminotransferase [Methanoculleus sp. 7T]|uniref:DegT/DnrJ/EryC1/StrS family aminotransferase n=1 Tax=Methanoculleus sp. 7T TaxID=2937282 RepID=UPI0020BE12C0|nr:DegT/DnrJ/EryC1/StrS family aminotransferase [Methanoculleus sp. 7T]MCK8519403.1 DegT/DnrJ/EryC1/StrS family aminotransferase [Methanoculleus sp. 7T]
MPGYELMGEEERDAVMDIFEHGGVLSRYGMDGRRVGIYRVAAFEEAFAKRMGVRHAVAVSSGTAALKAALIALGVGPGDEVVTQCHTFVATVGAIVDAGAVPVIVDIDRTLNMDPEDLAAAVTDRTKAIIPVHTMGVAARMDEILAVAREHGIPVLEDAAQACGGSYRGRMLGTLGDAGAVSFDFDKEITTGEGGMVFSKSGEVTARVRAYTNHGREMQEENTPKPSDPQRCLGFNYRMSEVQGALGLAQLPKLDEVLRRQQENKQQIVEEIAGLPGIELREVPDSAGDTGSTVTFFLESPKQAAAFARRWRERGLELRNLPDQLQWDFAGEWGSVLSRYTPRGPGRWSRSAEVLTRGIAIPVNAIMAPERLARIIESVRFCLAHS